MTNKIINFKRKYVKTIKYKLKKLISVLMLISILISTCAFTIEVFAANGTLQWLGTNKALGSPLLEDNFNADDWNKWELICFGVFLSNFTEPLIDDYKSAFGTGYGGSEGAGAKALAFDSGNRKTSLESILAYAVKMQQAYTREIYFKGAAVTGLGNSLITDVSDIKEVSTLLKTSRGDGTVDDTMYDLGVERKSEENQKMRRL